MILARLFSKTDYATYRQAILVFTFAAPILLLGLPEALYYFLSDEKKRPRAVLAENLIAVAVLGTLLSLFVLLGGGRFLADRFSNPDLAGVLVVMSPFPLLSMPVRSIRSYLVIYDRVKQVAGLDVLGRVLMLLFAVGAGLIWGTPIAAVAGMVIAAGLTLIPAAWFTTACLPSLGPWKPTAQGMRKQVAYAVPLGLATMTGMIVRALDKIIVSSMCSPEEFAVYVNGAMQIPIVAIVTGSVMAVLLPEIVRFRKSGDSESAIRLWQKAAGKCALFIIPLMCVVLAMAPEIMSALYSRKYVGSATVFRLYALMLPLRVVTWGVLIMAADRNRLILLKTAIGLAINLALSIWFVSMWGVVGAVIGTIATAYGWNVVFNIFVIRKLYKVKIHKLLPYGSLLKMFLLSTAACVVFIPNWLWRGELTGNSWLLLAIYLPAYFVLLLVLFASFKLVRPSDWIQHIPIRWKKP